MEIRNKGYRSLFFLNINALYVSLLINIALQLYATQCGIGLTFDSYDYIASAQSLAKTGELLRRDGSIHTDRTPLLSFLLSFHTTNILLWAKILNILTFVAIITLIFFWAKRLQFSPLINFFLVLHISIAMPLHLVHHFLWSEPLFILFLLFIFFYLSEYQIAENKNLILGLAIFWSNLLCLQRNAGIVFIFFLATGAFFFIFKKNKWQNTLTYAVGSVVSWCFFTLWAKMIAKGSLNNNLNNFLVDMLQKNNLYEYANVATAWVMPLQIPLWIRILIGSIAILLLLYQYSKNSKQTPKDIFLLLLWVLGGYVLVMQFIEKVDFHEIERYLAVCFPFVLILIFKQLDIFYQHTKEKLIKQLFIFLLILSLIYPTYRTVKNLAFFQQRNCKTA